MMEMLEERIADKSFMRLVGKCLHVGVMDGEVSDSVLCGDGQKSVALYPDTTPENLFLVSSV